MIWLHAAPSEVDGLLVYRNTVARGAVDVLIASHPTLERMVGEPWLRAAATVFARQSPPRRPSLQTYGEGFADWLAHFPPAADTPYLAAMAHLDGMWWSSYFSADAALLTAAAFAGLTADTLSGKVGRLHPSGLAAFDQTLASLWLAHQPPNPPPQAFEITDDAEWIVMARPGLEVHARRLDRAAYLFLAACAEGDSLLTAAERALAADADAQLPEIIAIGLELGVFARLNPSPQGGTRP